MRPTKKRDTRRSHADGDKSSTLKEGNDGNDENKLLFAGGMAGALGTGVEVEDGSATKAGVTAVPAGVTAVPAGPPGELDEVGDERKYVTIRSSMAATFRAIVRMITDLGRHKARKRPTQGEARVRPT